MLQFLLSYAQCSEAHLCKVPRPEANGEAGLVSAHCGAWRIPVVSGALVELLRDGPGSGSCVLRFVSLSNE